MARLFEDGFDHYGTDEGNMTDGVYATAGGGTTLSTSPTPPTGTHCVGILSYDNSDGFAGLRKVLPASKDKMGLTCRIYYPNLPNDSRGITWDFLTSSPNESQIRAIVNPQGAIEFWRGGLSTFSSINNGTLIAQTDPWITAAAWHHVELQLYIHDTLGWIRCAINSIPRFEQTGLDTKTNSSNIPSVGFHSAFTFTRPRYYDDLILYDFEGDPDIDTDFCPHTDGTGLATDFIGELQVMWRPPNGDTAEDDWVASTGTDSSAMVDETTPNDADYIYAVNDTDLSEFDLTDLPPEITYIRGTTAWVRASKADSGACLITLGSKSSAAIYDAPERPVTIAATYWWDQINVDPNTGVRWTRTNWNASKFRLARTL